jgi:triosephosphate isomerase
MKKLMAANWKMHKTRAEARDTARDMVGLIADKLAADREVLLIPPFLAIPEVAQALAGVPGFLTGAQDFYPETHGAFTGEVSPGMLADAGATFALTGHSERRHVLGESDELVGKKTVFGLKNGLSVILCVGETIEERRAGKVAEVLNRQLDAGLAGVDAELSARLVVAYEPVWAIGTGVTAQTADILEAHALVRARLGVLLPATGAGVRILYGGSVKPDNAGEIIGLDNVEGVLVGGASLTAESFSRIVLA